MYVWVLMDNDMDIHDEYVSTCMYVCMYVCSYHSLYVAVARFFQDICE